MRGDSGGGIFSEGRNIFSPPTTNIAAWVDGRVQTQTVGSVNSNSPNGRVGRIPDSVSGTWIAGSAAVSGFRNKNSLDLQAGNVTALACPAGLTIPGNNFTAGFAGQMYAMNGQGNLGLGMILGCSGGGNGGLAFNPLAGDGKKNTFSWFVSNVSKQSSILVPCGTKYALIVRGNAGNIFFDARLDGGPMVSTSIAAVTPATLSTFILGNIAAAYSGQQIVSQVALYSAMMANGSTDFNQLLNFLNSQAQELEEPIEAPLVTVIGDSNSTGLGSLTQSAAMFSAAQFSLYSKSSPPRFFLAGYPGCTLAEAIADFPTRIAPRINSGRGTNIVVVQAGAADMFSGASTAAQTYALVQTLCGMITAAGGTPVTCTVCPIDNAGVPGFDAIRNAFNVLLTAGFAGFSAALIPLGTTVASGINLLADCSGVNFAADKQHLSALGSAIATSIILPVLSPLVPP